MGSRTLCNACGVMYKTKGVLLAEYRPVNSPSYSNEDHSNYHRKALEMKKGCATGDNKEERIDDYGSTRIRQFAASPGLLQNLFLRPKSC